MKAAFIHANVIDVLERKTLIDQTVLIEAGFAPWARSWIPLGIR